ncbi:hypothetical protein [Paenibacillus odorifer]|jgi:hypothetical protein|nr:hypothetical protein [Paenibacillus odorifer]
MFRLEIDALNAIYEQQCKTNELLQKLVHQKESETKRPATRNKGGETC